MSAVLKLSHALTFQELYQHHLSVFRNPNPFVHTFLKEHTLCAFEGGYCVTQAHSCQPVVGAQRCAHKLI